jgi:glutaredoxin
VKKPLFIILSLFLVSYYVISQLSNDDLSDEPVVISTEQPPEIIMFTNQSCTSCAIARTFFKKHKLAYTEKDIERHAQHREMFYRLGGQGTPLIIINKAIAHGFDEKQIRGML